MSGGLQRFVVAGLGSIGQRHLRNLRQLKPQARIATWRLSATSGGEPLPQGADAQFTTLAEVLEFAPQAAVVSGPATTHLGVARPLAEAGVHLLVEKPLAEDPKGVMDLVALCRARGLVLMTAYNLRFLPSLRAAKACLDEGRIGEVLMARAEVGQYLPDWRQGSDYRKGVSAQRALGGGALLELSHELDYLTWMFGAPQRVTARGGRYGHLDLDVEDAVEMILEYAAPRRLVNVHLDMLQRAPHRACRFIGSEGTLLWDGLGDRLDLYRADTAAWETVPVPAMSDRNRMYLDEMQHFIDCAESGAAPLVDGMDGLRVLAIAAAARDSMARSTSVEVSDLAA